MFAAASGTSLAAGREHRQAGRWYPAPVPAITLFIMDAEFIGGMVLVAAVFVVMAILVLVSRARVERFHREGARPWRSRFRGERRE